MLSVGCAFSGVCVVDDVLVPASDVVLHGSHGVVRDDFPATGCKFLVVQVCEEEVYKNSFLVI